MELILLVFEYAYYIVLDVCLFWVVWALMIPCAFIIATPFVLVVALIRTGGFRENCKRYYGVIWRHNRDMVEWRRTRRSERSSRSS